MIDDLLDASGPQRAKAMGHPTRHRLLLELGHDGATISQLANRMQSNKGSGSRRRRTDLVCSQACEASRPPCRALTGTG